MLKKKYHVIIVFLISSVCFSQKIKVIDIVSNNSIPYANFSIYKDKKIVQGSYCNENGEMLIKQDLLFDSIVVSCIGYEEQNFIKEMIVNDTLFLKPTVYHLKEVVIKTNRNNDFETLGFVETKSKSLIGAFKGMEICTFIENPSGEVKFIHSFLFKIRNTNKTKLGFRLHLYEMDTIRRTPTQELLNQDIIVVIENDGKKQIEHDVSAYSIELPANGAFIGIEWLGELNEANNNFEDTVFENGFIELNDKINSFTTFQRNRFGVFPWSNMERFKKEAENYQNYKNCPNASFGIKVYKE